MQELLEKKEAAETDRKILRVCFVCTGNTCRSPMAEAAANALSKETGAPLEFFSAGLYANEDYPSTYLFHEEKDTVVLAKGSELLNEALDFFEVDHQFDLFQDEAGGDGGMHGFGVTEELPEASAWMGHALSFLKERRF